MSRSSRSDDCRDVRESLDNIDLAVLAMTGDVAAAEAHTRKYHDLAEALTDRGGYLPGEE